MNKQSQPRVESLLKQMPLVEPPESLDQKISLIVEEKSNPVRPVVSNGFGWPAMISTTVVAALVGIVLGVSGSEFVKGNSATSNRISDLSSKTNLIDSARMREVVAFQELHGHSGQEEFRTCSKCHKFAAKEGQVFEKWTPDFDLEQHHRLGQNCSLCHAKEEGAIEDPERPNPHEHADPAFSACSDCHLLDVENQQLEEHWPIEDIHEGFHPAFWQNCSTCHLENLDSVDELHHTRG